MPLASVDCIGGDVDCRYHDRYFRQPPGGVSQQQRGKDEVGKAAEPAREADEANNQRAAMKRPAENQRDRYGGYERKAAAHRGTYSGEEANHRLWAAARAFGAKRWASGSHARMRRSNESKNEAAGADRVRRVLTVVCVMKRLRKRRSDIASAQAHPGGGHQLVHSAPSEPRRCAADARSGTLASRDERIQRESSAPHRYSGQRCTQSPTLSVVASRTSERCR